MKKFAILTLFFFAIGLILLCTFYKNLNNQDQIVIVYSSDCNWPNGLGLGNQFMNYVLGHQFAKKIGTNKIYIYHNILCSGNDGFKDTSKRCYGLHRFGIEAPIILDIDSFTSKYDKDLILDVDELKYYDLPKEVFKKYKVFLVKFVFKKNLTEYFDKDKDEIKSIFKFQGNLSSEAKNILIEIKNSDSISMHIRRGDSVALRWNVPISYHIKAAYFILQKIPNAKFFIFTDDSNFVRRYIGNIKNITKDLTAVNATTSQIKVFQEKLKHSVNVSEKINHSIEEFYLMSECKNNIIPRSIFSWWAAFLNRNPNKIVVLPTISVHKKFDGNFPKIPQENTWIELP